MQILFSQGAGKKEKPARKARQVAEEARMQIHSETQRMIRGETRPRGYKTFFMLNSVEHEILNVHKYKNIEKFGFFRLRKA